jgi:hypothetical protein
MAVPTCNGCERYVSHSFVRVFGNQGEVKRCMHCARNADLQDGEAAK